MSAFKNVLGFFLSNKKQKENKSEFIQYKHQGNCKIPCWDCNSRKYRIFLRKTEPTLPAHPNCDCFYKDIEVKPVGTISQKGLDSPDVWLTLYNKLPDYYITKKQANEIYGWSYRKNTLAGKAPGKMIGGDIYYNSRFILPLQDGRIWYECDIDYISGARNSKRLFYSNDGLMFFSPDHGETTFYQVK
ncbi:MAG: phage head morphogenesis protein [Clostridia bacterium]|nr:phage head morphogenesis protein [Clostridia bacterium]